MKEVLTSDEMKRKNFVNSLSRNVVKSELFGTPLIQRLLKKEEEEDDADLDQYAKEMVAKYVETVMENENWYDLDEEEECRAVMVVWLCIGGSVAAVAEEGKYVELFLNEDSVSEYNVNLTF